VARTRSATPGTHPSDPTGEGPDFDWFDISLETAVTLGDNDATPPIPIGFGFTYYGTTYNNVYIGSNGLVGFTGTSLGQFSNTVLPTAGIPNRMIAAFWDDLAPQQRRNHHLVFRCGQRPVHRAVHRRARPSPPGGCIPSR
jgi:hypothetical protein